MKKHLSILLGICLLLVICACSSEEPSIVGAWFAEDGGSMLGQCAIEPSAYDVYYIFNENGCGQILNVFPEDYSPRNITVDFKYTIGENNSIIMDAASVHSEGTYKIDGNTLHLDTNRVKADIIRVPLEDLPIPE